ncbi:hypothetical protein [Methylobacterium tarhaniae]|uniref:hypothetical protein n=1 Tax=Methylobacterium tarhaniae TaxID=1187852 RepID=UPI000AD0BD70|nr:hypothetical protein [Methylobacterium tarhaniae]
MTVQARRMFDFSESVTVQSGEEIRAHIRLQLEKLLAARKAGGTRIRVEAECCEFRA